MGWPQAAVSYLLNMETAQHTQYLPNIYGILSTYVLGFVQLPCITRLLKRC